MKKFILLLLVLVAAYVAYPYWCLNRFDKAVEAGDKDAINQLVDFPQLRASVSGEIRKKLLSEFVAQLEASPHPQAKPLLGMVNKSLDAFVETTLSAEGLIQMHRAMKKLGKDAEEKYTWRFFTNPTEFKAETDRDSKIFLRLQGGTWKVSRLEFPDDTWRQDRATLEAQFRADPKIQQILNERR